MHQRNIHLILDGRAEWRQAFSGSGARSRAAIIRLGRASIYRLASRSESYYKNCCRGIRLNQGQLIVRQKHNSIWCARIHAIQRPH